MDLWRAINLDGTGEHVVVDGGGLPSIVRTPAKFCLLLLDGNVDTVGTLEATTQKLLTIPSRIVPGRE